MKYLIKIDRIAAWILLISMFVYFVSGYGMTKGIIDANLALNLHTKYLPNIIVLAFALHTSFAVHLALKRWRIWNVVTKSSLVLIYVLFVTGFVYYENFYTRPMPQTNTTAVSNAGTSTQNVVTTNGGDDDNEDGVTTQTTQNTTSGQTGNTSTIKTFTVSELASYNGQNGQPAYVAVDGSVYDVSRLFLGGYHFTHFAGRDLTNAFYSQHAKSKLANYPIIGQLK